MSDTGWQSGVRASDDLLSRFWIITQGDDGAPDKQWMATASQWLADLAEHGSERLP